MKRDIGDKQTLHVPPLAYFGHLEFEFLSVPTVEIGH